MKQNAMKEDMPARVHEGEREAARATKGCARRWIAALVVIALTGLTAQGPASARADALDDAYSDGKLFGAGIPMVSWGVLSTISAVKGIAEKGGIDASDAVPLSFGLTQMAAGGILLGVGASGRPSDSLGRSAFSAGSDVGAGVAMIAYGSLLGLSSAFLLFELLDDTSGETDWEWVAFTVAVALSGFQIGYGAYLVSSGGEDFDNLKATAQTSQPMFVMPLLSFGF